MTRTMTIIGIFLTIAIGTGTYWVSYEVESLEKQYAALQGPSVPLLQGYTRAAISLRTTTTSEDPILI